MPMSRGAFQTVKESTRWLAAVYFNELAFVTGFPLFLLHPPDLIPSGKKLGDIADGLGFRERMAAWWKAVQNKESRHQLLLTQAPHLYDRFVWFEVVLWVVCSVLKLVWLDTLMIQEADIEADAATAPREITHTAFSGPKLKVLYAALAVHFVQYAVHRYHLINCVPSSSEERAAEAELKPWAYWLAHVSIINFSIDFPGLMMPDVKFSNTLIILINLAAMSMFVFLVMAEEPISEAWGCYPSWTGINGLKYGLCPAWLNKYDPESPLAPVCTAVTGAECQTEGARWSATLNHAFTVARSMLFISLTLYVWSVPTKIDYYSLRFKEARIVADKAS